MIVAFRKSILFLTLFFSFSTVVFSQLDEIDVETEIKKVSDDEYVLIFDFSIEEDWHLYCQHNPESASQAISIKAKDEGQKDFEFVKEVKGDFHKESKHHMEFSADFGIEQTFFSDEAKIKQKIKILNNKVKKIKIEISGQACNESCVPYKQYFEFKVGKKKKKKKNKGKKVKKQRKEADSSVVRDKTNLLYIGLALGGLLLLIILFFLFKKKKK